MKETRPTYEDGTIKKHVLRHLINGTNDQLNFQKQMIEKCEKENDFDKRRKYVLLACKTTRVLKFQNRIYLKLAA